MTTDADDWETMLWFLVAHVLHISNAHEKRLDELKSTIEVAETELYALTESCIMHIRQKRALHDQIIAKGTPLAADPKWLLTVKELDRAMEKFKQRIERMA